MSRDTIDLKQVAAWCLFDFANSSYSAVIAAIVFQVYSINAVVGNGTGRGGLCWGRAISASMLIVSITSLFVRGIADHAGLRKRLLGVYTATCVAAIAGSRCWSRAPMIALALAKAGRFDAIWVMVAVFFAICSAPAFLILPRDERSGIGAA